MTNSDLQILGIDAAANPKNVGLAAATADEGGRWRLTGVEVGHRGGDLAAQAAALIDPARPVLMAVDAPLGWPQAMAQSLIAHHAGEFVGASSDKLFIRETDRFVRRHTGLKPLEVGADRIARTARAALALVEALRQRTGQPLPLLLAPEEAEAGGLLEVYPAATLKQHGLPAKRYKKPEARRLRETIQAGIESRLAIGPHARTCQDSDHCLDAALCVLTAIDFLEGACHPPEDIALARREGWIWLSRKR